MVVSAVVLATKGWQPVGEMAMAEFRLRGFWSHPPDLGAVARLRVDAQVVAHPGPAAYWLLYPVYALFGRSASGLTLSVSVVASAWAGAAVMLTARRAGAAAATLLAGALLVMIGGLDPAVVTQPWNPWLAVFPFVFFLIACWDVLNDHPWSLVGVALAGSVGVQSHLGYVPVVGTVSVVALAAVLVRGSREGGWRRVRRPLTVAALVTAAVWAPAVVQQVFGEPGNLSMLWRGWNNGDLPPVGWWTAFRIVVRNLDPRGPWGTGGDAGSRTGVPVGTVALGVASAAVVVLGRREPRVGAWRPVLLLETTLALSTAAAVVGIGRATGVVYDYLVIWLAVIGALAVFGVTWGLWLVGRPAVMRSGHRRTVAALAGVSVVVLALVATVRLDDPPVPDEPLSRTVAALAPQVEAVVDPGPRDLVRWTDPYFYGAVGFGLALRLERDGYDVGVDPGYRIEAMPWRARPATRADRSLWVVTGDAVERWRARGDMTEVARYDPRPVDQRPAAAAAHDRLVRRLSRLGGPDLVAKLATNQREILLDPRVDEGTKRDVTALAASGLPTSVFVGPPAATDVGSTPGTPR